MSEVANAKYRIGFAGQGELGYTVLEALLADESVEVPFIFACQTSAAEQWDPPVFESVAKANGIPFLRTNNLNDVYVVEKISGAKPDLVVAMLWATTISAGPVSCARDGFLNLHGGMLPRYRGNACQAWAILNQESSIGVSVHFMDPDKLDSGPIILQEEVPITDRTTVGELFKEIDRRGARMVLEAVELVRTGKAVPRKQDDSLALYCFPRLPRDGEIDWTHSAADIERLVRAVGEPYPGAYSYFADVRDQNRIKKMIVHKASVERHVIDFFGVPGHLVRLEQGNKWAVICGDSKLLVLEEIEVDGIRVMPREQFKTVRQRFGLDTETMIASFGEISLERFANQFPQYHARQLEIMEESVDLLMDKAYSEFLSQGISMQINPLRNYSFHKRFFDWTQRETWFGIQIYRSMRFVDSVEESVAIGYWLFSETDQGLTRRIYVSVKQEFHHLYRELIDRVLGSRGQKVFCSGAGGWYLDVTASQSSQIIPMMQEIGMEFVNTKPKVDTRSVSVSEQTSDSK